jgi:hypothetical protein
MNPEKIKKPLSRIGMLHSTSKKKEKWYFDFVPKTI